MNEPISRRTVLRAGSALPLGGALALRTRAAQPPKRPLIEAYAMPQSYIAGEEVKVRLSCQGDSYWYKVFRHGAAKEEVASGMVENPRPHDIPKDASANGCRWPVGLTVRTTGWRTGYYSVSFGSTKGPAVDLADAFFVLRPKRPGRDADILLPLATNTYNAYTNWGGYSLYAYHGRHKVQGRRVSFDRPQFSQFPRWEEPFVRWAEKAGYALDFCTNLDLEFHPELLKRYKLVLSVGHDEYWSAPMRDALEGYIANGGNVAFFSGNTCCWQVRTEDQGAALRCWKQSFGDDPVYQTGDHKTLSTLWSHYLVNRPENHLTGVGFLWGGYHRSHGQFMDGSGAFTAHRPEHWLFAGTGLKRGDAFGAKLPEYKVVGYECDGCELVWKDGLPFPTHTDGTPKGFEVLATAPARWHPDDAEWYERWAKGRTGNAVVGTYTRGGTVVTVGTTDWAFGLRGNDPNITRITRNVLDKLGT
ncbi:MAG TPA: N,N-dimethylformamidase beta subunit family domain-containing protein [Gemmata sp.]